MKKYEMIRVREHRELVMQAAGWFHQKWGIPEAAYTESMEKCLEGSSLVPQWYIVRDGDAIVAGIGVIENDFHDRKDLRPNICGVYVEEDYRGRGIAGEMLRFVCDDLKGKGIDTLYLLTDLTSFYERYGWEFLCLVQGDGEPGMARMYIYR